MADPKDKLISFRLPIRQMSKAEKMAEEKRLPLGRWARALVLEAMLNSEEAPGVVAGYNMALAEALGWIESGMKKPEVIEKMTAAYRPSSDRGWLLKAAAIEDGCIVSVGGLVGDIEARPILEEASPADRPDFTTYQTPGEVLEEARAAVRAHHARRTWAEEWADLKGMEPHHRIARYNELRAGRDLPPEFAKWEEAIKIKWLDANWPL